MKIAIAIVSLVALAGSAQGQLATWNLNGQAGNQASNAASASNAAIVGASLTRGAGLTAQTGTNSMNSSNFSLSSSFSNSVTSYYQVSFTVAPQTYVTLNTIYTNLSRSASGPSIARWQYSIDGGTTWTNTWATFAANTAGDISGISTSTTSTAGATRNFYPNPSAPSASPVVSSLNGTILMRLFGWSATGTAGTLRLSSPNATSTGDAIRINGTAAANQAPTINPNPFTGPTFNTDVDTSASFNLLTGADPEGRPISYGGLVQPIGVSGATLAANGAFNWNLAGVANGLYTFGYSVTDELGLSTQGTFTVNVIPTPGSLALLGMGGLIAGRRRRA
ncbi:MAG: hypothetical protein IBJ18_10155 [Phycisphaerales bacterium]|nr:hypothetical protein [Phycisphaerales bacterium]